MIGQSPTVIISLSLLFSIHAHHVLTIDTQSQIGGDKDKLSSAPLFPAVCYRRSGSLGLGLGGVTGKADSTIKCENKAEILSSVRSEIGTKSMPEATSIF